MVCGRGRGSGFFVKRGQATSLYHIGVSLQVKSQDFFERKRNKKFGKKTGLHNPVRFYRTKVQACMLRYLTCRSAGWHLQGGRLKEALAEDFEFERELREAVGCYMIGGDGFRMKVWIDNRYKIGQLPLWQGELKDFLQYVGKKTVSSDFTRRTGIEICDLL